MQRIAGLLALALTAALLAGCAYDPYTGTYAPCCGYYGYPYGYRYPPPYAPYGYPSGPYMAQPPSQPGAYVSPPPIAARAVCDRSRVSRAHTHRRRTQSQPAPYAPPQQSQPGHTRHHPANRQPSRMRRPLAAGGVPAGQLAAISATHDGRLTRDQRDGRHAAGRRGASARCEGRPLA